MQGASETTKKHPQTSSCASKVCKLLRSHVLIISTVTAAFLGFGFGFAIRQAHPSQNALIWIGLPGELYMRMLKMMIVPLVISSIISEKAHLSLRPGAEISCADSNNDLCTVYKNSECCGTMSLDPKSNGKVSLVGFTYIFITNTIGALIGLAGAMIAQPGKYVAVSAMDQCCSQDFDTYCSDGSGKDGALGMDHIEKPSSKLETQDIFVDLIRNLFPDNLFESTFSKSQTMYETPKRIACCNLTNSNLSETVAAATKYVGKSDGTNLLGLIVACTLFGMAFSQLRERGTAVLEFFTGIYDGTIVIVRWLMWFTPVGVFFLIGVAVARIEHIETLFSQLGVFVLTVFLCIVVQQAVVYTVILLVIARTNPLRFYASMAKPWLIAFASAATAVAMPEMIVACEVTHKLDKGITRFIIPLAVTVSANGSAVFIACACIFSCNISGMPPSAANVVQIGLLTSVASMAIPSVPSSSIVTIIMILTSMNIPVNAVALLLAVEWFLDRIRTTSSVLSDCVCVAVTQKFCRKLLEKHEHPVEEIMEDKSKKYPTKNGDACELQLLNYMENGVTQKT